MIESPYLLFLADVPDLADAKTAVGIAHWRADRCVGELSYDTEVTVGLPQVDLEQAVQRGARTLVLGVVNAGGHLKPRWIETIRDALEAGLDVACGMHTFLAGIPEIASTAERLGRKLHDVRRPPADLLVGSGQPRTGRRILTVGTDCAVGKMFTALALEREMVARGMNATFRATGQTGILIAGAGVAVDAVVADFISGAAERIAPSSDPDHWDLVEGQGSLFHPAFAGVSLGLLHGAQPDLMVMCHDPVRTVMRGDTIRHPLPDLKDCIETNERMARLVQPDSRVVGIAVNTSALEQQAALDLLANIENDVGLPTCDPVRTGVGALVDAAQRSAG